MGIYADQVLPRVQNKVMDREPLRPIRARICAGLKGAIVEIGFGTGVNAPYYPSAVERVVAIEPSHVCMRLAEPRIAESHVVVENGGLTGERLDLPSDEFDAVLSTWTMCTIPNLDAALAEVRRVLKPGASLHFVEHGHAPDAKVARWQERIEPVWKPLAGGCHLTRRIGDDLERAGFRIENLDNYYLPREPKSMGYIYEGRATPQ
jgi:ubiquinone/menaquinone biosynthesis C-methylase UbiE